ncbi:serine/threonine-protein kinase [Rariglobus hedericola]|uniref:Serine/threonine protein kinase n=1 Tax=Rariglobus hedericola TaxID=2597822 RepID=A0A556QJ15_9BACT|nr:serine/threonine-protein kinase [Rariglobus hedericola]TSJ76643.1 serine/threonine protein kinase [Rariglobus hedericola]
MSDEKTPPSDPTADLLARGLGLTGARPPAWQTPDAALLADLFPGLRVISLAGRGGMGAVYRAEQIRLGRTVAVKIMPPEATPDPMARERFEREARVLSGLNHPHVLQIFDFGALADGTLYLVTEWAEGGDLAQLLSGKPHPVAVVQDWVAQIASALDAAHARGIVHRDLKPANVLVRADGRLALADFGLAQAQGQGFTTSLTMTGMIFGTLDYMSPEQMTPGEPVTAATDVYALGVMTYQMLTGRVPKGAYPRPSRFTDTPVAVDALIDAAMSNEVGMRPAKAGEFARKLSVIAGVKPKSKRLWLSGILLVVAASAAAWAWVQVDQPVEPASVVENQIPKLETPSLLPAVVEPVVVAEGKSAPAAPAPEVPVMPEASMTGPEVVESNPVAMVPMAAKKTDAKTETPVPWTWLLGEVRPARDALRGTWSMRGKELVAGNDICVLRLPVQVAENYDVAVEFTRTSGRNSIGVFLPTLAGEGVFELDAWDLGIGGVQRINGQDMRGHGQFFPAKLKNGEKQQVILQVRGSRVSATWNGEPRMTWDLTGRRFDSTVLWETGAGIGLGLCAWKSPTVFHRVAYRAMPAE